MDDNNARDSGRSWSMRRLLLDMMMIFECALLCVERARADLFGINEERERPRGCPSVWMFRVSNLIG